MIRALLLAAAFAAPGSARADEGETISEIRVERLNVFDPAVKGEDWWPFNIANKIHYMTRESVIRRELLFAPGDKWNTLKTLQSERNLRANGSFRRADILPERLPDGRLGALVRTQDSWTTNPRFSAGTEGGQSFFALGLEEGNILGLGKAAAFDVSRNQGRTTSSWSYGDPRFLATRLALRGSYARGTNGDSGAASLTRPFFALESAQAQAIAWSRTLSDVDLFRDGDTVSSFRERRRIAETSLGLKANSDDLFVHRAEAGWYADRRQFERTSETNGPLPIGTEMSGPTIGWSWVQARYVKEEYIDRMERVEDYNLGNELSLRAGWMGEKTGSDRDRTVLNFSDQHGVRFAPGRFAIARVGVTGRMSNGRVENGLATANLNVFWKTNWRGNHTLVGHIEGAAGRNLDRSSYLALGGATGLRGYRNNSFIGGKAVLLNFEDRFFFPGEYFHLVRLGAALFVDTGFMAMEGENLALRSIKSDVGAGLRFASSRSRSGSVARIDLAYALNDGPGRTRWVLSIKGGQAFSLFNSASRSVDPAPPSRLY